jgi:hypothetical protein
LKKDAWTDWTWIGLTGNGTDERLKGRPTLLASSFPELENDRSIRRIEVHVKLTEDGGDVYTSEANRTHRDERFFLAGMTLPKTIPESPKRLRAWVRWRALERVTVAEPTDSLLDVMVDEGVSKCEKIADSVVTCFFVHTVLFHNRDTKIGMTDQSSSDVRAEQYGRETRRIVEQVNSWRFFTKEAQTKWENLMKTAFAELFGIGSSKEYYKGVPYETLKSMGELYAIECGGARSNKVFIYE